MNLENSFLRNFSTSHLTLGSILETTEEKQFFTRFCARVEIPLDPVPDLQNIVELVSSDTYTYYV